MKHILIIDDQPLTGRGIAATLDGIPDFQVLTPVSSVAKAMEILQEYPIDVIIIEIMLPDFDGPHFFDQVLQIRPDIALIAVTRCEDMLCFERALRAGVRGYVLKSEACNTIVHAVYRVIDGGFYVSERVSDKLLLEITRSPRSLFVAPNELLSEQELTVFELTGQGLNAREISERLDISVKTVESYRNRAKSKLNLKTSSDLFQEAVKWNQKKGPCYAWQSYENDETDRLDDSSDQMVDLETNVHSV